MAARKRRAPLEDDTAVVFLEPAAPLQRLPVECLEDLRHTAVAQHTARVLAHGAAASLILRG